eukprot:scaffold26.g3368.t1
MDITPLLSGNSAPFEQLLSALTSSANDQRSSAEAALAELRKHPDACASHLVRSLRSSPDLQSRALCAVLTRDEPSLWPGMSPGAKALVRAEMLNCLREEEMRSITKKDVIAPYLDTLISKLLALLQSGRRNEGALTALASVADCAQHATDKAHAAMRAKALECVSLVGMAVGKERFAADAAAVMAYMQSVQAAGLDPDDPLPSYMLQAGARICKTLGQDFLPYLQVVMPPLLHSAQLKPDVTVGDAGSSDEEEDGDVETFIVGDRKVSLSTSALEEKGTACAMLCCYAEELGAGFCPYVASLCEAFKTVLADYEERRRERVERMTSEDFDTEEAEALEEEHEAEGELLDSLATVLTRLLREYGDGAMPLVEELMPAVGRLLEKGRFPEERRVALCVMDDVLEHSPGGAAKYAAQVLPLLLAGCSDRDPTIRQCCVYGLGTAARHRRELFAPHAPAAVAAILGVLQAPDARWAGRREGSDDNELAFENAVSALGKAHLPADVFAGFVAALKPKQQAALQAVLAGVPPPQ